MKRTLKKIILALLFAALLLGGCVRPETSPETKPALIPPLPAEAPSQKDIAAPSSASAPSAPLPTPTEQIAVPKQLPSVEDPEKGIFVIDPLEPQEYFDIKKMRLQRISRDRGELKELTIVLRNIGSEPLTPTVRLLFDKADVKGTEGKIEQDFPVPAIPSGMKLVKEFPVSILFSNLEKDKTLTLKFYKKFESPRSYYGTYKRTFKPIDEFENLEIKWI